MHTRACACPQRRATLTAPPPDPLLARAPLGARLLPAPPWPVLLCPRPAPHTPHCHPHTVTPHTTPPHATRRSRQVMVLAIATFIFQLAHHYEAEPLLACVTMGLVVVNRRCGCAGSVRACEGGWVVGGAARCGTPGGGGMGAAGKAAARVGGAVGRAGTGPAPKAATQRGGNKLCRKPDGRARCAPGRRPRDLALKSPPPTLLPCVPLPRPLRPGTSVLTRRRRSSTAWSTRSCPSPTWPSLASRGRRSKWCVRVAARGPGFWGLWGAFRRG